jgi:sensor histidine kinase YesM
MEYVQKDIDVYATDMYTTDYMLQIYFQAGIGQIGLITLYAVIMLFFYFIFRIIGKNMPQMGLLELIFLSVLNVVGIILTYMVTDLSIVRLDNDVFLLFENQHQMFWKIPTMVCLLMVGEFSLIGVWKNYRNVLVEWQKTNAMEEQLKQMKNRYEEVGTFYSDIRKMRHEMRNHMMNIKGLVASEKYSEVGSYIEKMDESLCKIDFKYSTGNPLCDVIINDKLGRAERLNIACNVRFMYQETNTISTFDFGIILSNLLDNAIEACEKVIEGKRFIDLELSVKGSFLLLKVENSYDGHLVWDLEDKLPISTKGNTQQGKMLAMHGLGLENVSELADKYLGGVKIEEDKGIFRIIVMLQK